MTQHASARAEPARSNNVKTRNPFGVMDVPSPNDRDVEEFAAASSLDGSSSDANAHDWCRKSSSIEGPWASRWNGGADSTVPGDTADQWKQGAGEVRSLGDRVYLLFDWNGGLRKGLIDARREDGGRLVGKYINLTAPEIIRPWIGLIVDNNRIDGRWTGGRLDFRR